MAKKRVLGVVGMGHVGAHVAYACLLYTSISIGTIGLIKGVSSYRPEKGTRLATYAAKCVENAILS